MYLGHTVSVCNLKFLYKKNRPSQCHLILEVRTHLTSKITYFIQPHLMATSVTATTALQHTSQRLSTRLLLIALQLASVSKFFAASFNSFGGDQKQRLKWPTVKFVVTQIKTHCYPKQSFSYRNQNTLLPKLKLQSPKSKLQLPYSRFQLPKLKLQLPKKKFQLHNSRLNL